MNVIQPSLSEIARATIATFTEHDREQCRQVEADAEQRARTEAQALADRRLAYAELVTMTKAAFGMPLA